ncbi:MAG: pyrophosphohydrolase [Francisellaceae bacterium]|nr:pyrophosphohydrolase [Francisellaceae bacterium]
MIDSNGFRPNIGIILANKEGKLFWAKRIGQEAWQFPQGGAHDNEEPIDTLYRELYEEVGLKEQDVKILGRTRHWLRYRIPTRFIRNTEPVCIGQKQLWFLLQLQSDVSQIQLSLTAKPEFDGWEWVNYWYPLHQVVNFKREVYRKALKELLPFLQKTQVTRFRGNLLNHLLESRNI